MKGEQVTPRYLERHSFNYPIMVTEMEGLGLKLPPKTFSVKDVEQYVGKNYYQVTAGASGPVNTTTYQFLPCIHTKPSFSPKPHRGIYSLMKTLLKVDQFRYSGCFDLQPQRP